MMNTMFGGAGMMSVPPWYGATMPPPTNPSNRSAPADSLAAATTAAASCRVCADHLPLGPRPTFRVSDTARILVIGQAPGTKVHATGIPWNDPSGDRLRLWLAMDRDAFYDASR